MKLAVEMPEEAYKLLQTDGVDWLGAEHILSAVANGKPLDDVLDEIRAEIEPKCDRINSLASVLPYTAHREIQELLCEIMNLCKAESEEEGGQG